jgi:hypothetical protein
MELIVVLTIIAKWFFEIIGVGCTITTLVVVALVVKWTKEDSEIEKR